MGRETTDEIKKQPSKPLGLMPSLKKANAKEEVQEEDQAFDEEREQQLLEEARKKKERARKIRE